MSVHSTSSGIREDHNVPVIAQDQTTPPFQYYLMQHLNEAVTLASPVAVDDETVLLNAGHGFVVGNHIAIWENSAVLQSEVISVSTNTIGIDMPSGNDFSTASTVIRGTIDLAVNGAAGIDFLFKPFDLSVPVDIRKVVITIESGANVPDNGKFGGISALTNGLYFRQVNGTRVNLGNYRKNKDFIDTGAHVSYTSKAPAGTNGTDIVFDIEDAFDVVLRVSSSDQYILGRLRDNLSGLDAMYVSLLGQYTLGE